MKLRPLPFLLALGATLGSAHAAEDEDLALAYGDQATVSIATGSKQPLRRAPAVATVFTADDIQAMGATDLEDVLARVPGLHVSRTSLLYSPLWVMRGIYSQFNQQILVLHNGHPMTVSVRGDRGTKGWRGWPVETIARIEVLRGPGSALYGADAYAGVINIVTRNGRDLPKAEAGAHVGSFKSRDAWWQQGGVIGDFDYAWHVHRGFSDGFAATVEKDAQTANDAAFGTQVSHAPSALSVGRDTLDLGMDLGLRNWRLRATYQVRDMQSGIGVAQSLDAESLERTRRLLADLSWTEEHLGDSLGAGASLSYHGYQQLIPAPFVIFPPGAKFPTGSFPNAMLGAPETWEHQWRLSAYLNWTGWRGHQWRLGAGIDDIDLYRTAEGKNFSYAPNGLPIPLPSFSDHSDTDPFIRPQRRQVRYLYLQDSWQMAPDWSLTAGLRHDRFSDVGHTTNPRFALVWEAAHNLTAKLLHGQAYRAPGFAELYSITNPVARGNPNVKPETIRTTELALLWQPQRQMQLNLNLFRYRMEDIIRTTANPTPGTGTTFNNTGDQTGRGLELEWRWQVQPGLSLGAQWAHQRARDESTGAAPGYAPARVMSVDVDWRPHSAWALALRLLHVADRARALGDARPPVADYTRADLSLRWVQPRYTLSLHCRNCGNADIREPSLAPGRIVNDLPQAPRSLSLETTLRW
ncbi:TonB-dependent receptor plug domain-containing protein [Inhella gelatinilytica]|uniref:TonB-dependent receptor n=1 Tax=Inhella gelatinilytica TaxID=2795030 RepID=A0A931NDN7_9BURK|nr:TonB-dependent receptor [Inhella gelatinilytica]MBH9552814.1 TonB-dependent receptor [Inhella gelatinilytica]